MVNIKAISDTHGYIPEISGKIDLLLVAGDISPKQSTRKNTCSGWFGSVFIPWINSLDYRDDKSRVLLVPGNHDFMFDGISEDDVKRYEGLSGERLKILMDGGYVHSYMEDGKEKNVRIYGCPYCKEFYDWAFMVPNQELAAHYSMIPYGLDILITHDAPDLGGAGLIQEGRYKGKNAGNVLLSAAILDKKPAYAICGHIHSGNHKVTDCYGTMIANVSYVSESYIPTDYFLEFDYDPETRRGELSGKSKETENLQSYYDDIFGKNV